MARQKNVNEGIVQVRRKKVLDREKVKIALASLSEGVNKTKFCKEHGISSSSLYVWRRHLLNRLSEGL